jgi:hypothetical protein
MDSGRFQPALYGGLLIGVLSALPIVQYGNCCCCLWIIAGGMLAVYLRQQNSPYAVTSAEGALVGLLAGVIGGLIGAVLSVLIQSMLGPFQRQMIERLIAWRPDIFPPDIGDTIARADAAGRGPLRIALSMLFMVFIGTIFGMLGGLLGVAVFKKDAPPPPPPGTIEVLPPE